MKAGIHPDYVEATITCSCGNTFKTRSTAGDMHVELCAECHPFYTGKQKLVDSGGRVERFQRRYGRTTFTSEGGGAGSRQKAAEPDKSGPVPEEPPATAHAGAEEEAGAAPAEE